MKKHSTRLFMSMTLLLALFACGTMNEKNKGKGINLFTVRQDMQLGAQVAHEIDSNRREFPTLDSIKYKEVYAYLYGVRDKILNSGKVDFKDDFSWRLRIIRNDDVLNAFCTPGGYIYVYTGLLKFLDAEDQLAGVLGHEIGHADMRHSTRQMTQMYGVQLLLDVLAGNRVAIKQITTALIGLRFSRKHEVEADERSVVYLCPTDYNADGASAFFEKIQSLGGEKVPEFLSTHPDPGNRIEHFQNSRIVLGCTGTHNFKTAYQQMLEKLPK